MATTTRNLTGLIACGGQSSRMGSDKFLLQYYDKPQCYHLVDMLKPFCDNVYLSCNPTQSGLLQPGSPIIEDLLAFSGMGPMASLLSAITLFPENRFLLIGCDYPYLAASDISAFLHEIVETTRLASFFNRNTNLYEPLLSYYSPRSFPALLSQYRQSQYSLRRFLESNHAMKFFPLNEASMTSVDDQPGYLQAVNSIQARGF